MTIRHLRIFLEVATSGSMSQAAKNLHFSQSTISQAIKELELHYDTLLFHRLSKRLHITPSGEKLLTCGRSVVNQFDSLQLMMHEDSTFKHIRLGATITCGCCILPQFLRDFEHKVSDVTLTTCIYNTHIIEKKLLTGELDIALVEGHIKSKDLISVPIIEDHLALAFHCKHKFSKITSFQPADLSGQDFVIREEGSGTREAFESYLKKHQISINAKMEAPFPEAMKHAILYNNCLAVLSTRLLEKEIKAQQIQVLRLNTDEWNRHFSLVYHKDKYITDTLQIISDMLAQYQNLSTD